jgi:hypothetical protein
METTNLDLQEQFDQAELHADLNQLQRLLADDFLSIGPKAFVLNKRQWIDRHGQFKYLKLETSEQDVRLYDKTAIVRNLQPNKAVYQDETIEITVRVMQVWAEIDGRWQLAGIQFSPLAEDNE